MEIKFQKEGYGQGYYEGQMHERLEWIKKIKEKIEELKKEIEEKQENGCDFTLIHEHEIDTNAIIKVLQELLVE